MLYQAVKTYKSLTCLNDLSRVCQLQRLRGWGSLGGSGMAWRRQQWRRECGQWTGRCPQVSLREFIANPVVATGTITVYSRYIGIGGVQAMVPRYKRERDISGDCHEPKSDSTRGILEYLPITRSRFAAELSQCLDKIPDVNSVVKQWWFD